MRISLLLLSLVVSMLTFSQNKVTFSGTVSDVETEI